MDPNRFDALSRALTMPGSRRATLRALLSTLLGGALLGPSPDARAAAPKTKTKAKSRKATGRGGNGRGRPPHDRQAGQDRPKTKTGRQQGTRQRPESKAGDAATAEPVPEVAPARGEVAGQEVTAASHGCGHTGTACKADDQCCSGICGDVRGTCCLAKGKRCTRGAQCCSGRCNAKTRRCRGCPTATTKPCQGDCIPKERCCTDADCDDGVACTDDSCVDGACANRRVDERCQPPAGQCLRGHCNELEGCLFSSLCSLEDRVCQNGECVCPPPRVDCGTLCCFEGWACLRPGSCRQCDNGQPHCNGTCCRSGETCVSGACCLNTRVCGASCCAGDQTCIAGNCCPGVQACGAVCCPAGEVCNNPTDGTCGSSDL